MSLVGTSFHNTWRAIRFTIKGKKIGCSDDWKSFDKFTQDMWPSYVENFRIYRKNKALPFSKENCLWVDKSKLSEHKRVLLTYNGASKTLQTWCEELELNLNGVKLRYHRSKNYTAEQILFGRFKGQPKPQQNSKDLNLKQRRIKASKMLSSYKNKDFKKRFLGFDLSITWFLDNIMNQACTYCGTRDYIGADRIDNAKGHHKANIIPCCQRCNTTRSNHFTYEEMLKIGRFIRDEIDSKKTLLH